ncbi:MAG: chemotaxis protein CheW [Hyphomicrobiales bacterium]
MDDGILQEFLAESFENLAQVEQDLVVLERDPGDLARIASVFRAIHTVKGTCGFFGFSRLGALAHAGEDLLGALRGGRRTLTHEIVDTLLALVDGVRTILNHIAADRTEGDEDFAALVTALEGHRGPDGPGAAGAPPPGPPASPDEAHDHGLFAPLIASGRLDPEAVDRAARQQRLGDPRRIGEILVDHGAIEPKDVREALALQGDPSAQPQAEGSIRVDVHLLDALMNLVGELVLARNQLLQKMAASDLPDLAGTTQRLNLITTELQEGIMKTRMQPVASLCNKLPRLVRDVAAECGKEVRLELEGIDTELDRTIIESIRDPITHLIRNAIDHGIEAPEDRVARGKPREGRLLVHAFHEGGKVNLEITDDGAGLPIERIRAKAIRENLVPSERAAHLTEREWAQVVFLPGFSTAERVSSVSGRGVGMDVVKTNIERIGGTIDLDSRAGIGVLVRIRIPLTLAIVPALIVRVGDERYAIPQINLIELLRAEPGQDRDPVSTVVDTPVLRYRGGLLPLVDLRSALSLPGAPTAVAERPIAVLHADASAFGVVVDAIDASQEIVVKSLGESLRHVPVFAGATILGDGAVALILDVPGLARHAGVNVRAEPQSAGAEDAPARTDDAPTSTLVLCRVGRNWPVAIAQESISRLEEFPEERIERVGARRLVQYRGGILPLVGLADLLDAERAHPDDARGAATVHVVVCERDGRGVGLVVEDIVEIVEERLHAGLGAPRPGVSGTAVVRGRVTDLLDVEAILALAGRVLPAPAIAGAESGR